MNTNTGYSKKTLDNTNVLLSGGGDKPLSDFIGSISWDPTNRELKYGPIGGTEETLTLSSLAITNYTLPKATTSVLGGIIVSNALSTAVTLTSVNENATDRYYGVLRDKNGKAFVYIPWTSLSIDSLTSTKTTNLTIGTTVNGTATDVTLTDLITRSLSQTSLDSNNSLAYFYNSDGNLIYTAISGSSNTVGDKPGTTSTGGVLSFKTAGTYYGQIFLSSSGNLFVRSGSLTDNALTDSWEKVAYASKYLPLSGGSMSGAITFPCWSNANNNVTILFDNASTTKGKIGCSTVGLLGLYSSSSIAIRPSLTDNTKGLAITTSAFTYNGTDVSLAGHKHAYTDLTGSGTTENQAIVSSGTANGWQLKTVSLSTHNHDGTYLNPTKKITFYPANAGWYRIAKVSPGQGFDVIISGGYKNYSPSSIHIIGNAGWASLASYNEGRSKIVLISGVVKTGGNPDPTSSQGQFIKARIVYKFNSDCYLELYKKNTESEDITNAYIYIIKADEIYTSPIQSDTLPDGYTVDAELEFKDVNTGVVALESEVLALSGGTMTGALTVPKIRINGHHTSSSASYGIYYYENNTDYLLIGLGSANLWIGANETSGTHHPGSTYISAGTGEAYISRLVDSTRTNYKILDVGNYSSYALPLSGGTMTGALGVSTASSSYATAKGINIGDSIHIGGTTAGNIGIYTTGLIALRPGATMDASSSNGVLIKSDVFTYNGNEIWHAGNLTPSNFLDMTTSLSINKVLASPSSGSAGVPTFRSLVAADIPELPYVLSVSIATKTTTGLSWTPFASVSLASTSREKYCILLISGAGYYYNGGFTGSWIVELRATRATTSDGVTTNGTPSIKATCISPPYLASNYKFGYYIDGNTAYFGFHFSTRRGGFTVTVLQNRNSLFNIYAGTVVSTEPSGWLDVEYEHTVTSLPSSGSPAYGNSLNPVYVNSSGSIKACSFNFSSATATSLASLDMTKAFIYATISSDLTLSTSGNKEAGLATTVLVYNSDTVNNHTITIPSTIDSLDGNSLIVSAGKFLELSLMCYKIESSNSVYILSAKGQ